MARYYGPYGYHPPYGGGYGRYTNPKVVIYITLFIIVALLVLYFYVRKKANDDSKEELANTYAEDEQYTQADGVKIRAYATQIVEDLDGLNVYHNKDLYEAILRESDKIVAAVAVDYKRLAGESLRQALNNETSFGFTLPQSKLREKFIARLALINIF